MHTFTSTYPSPISPCRCNTGLSGEWWIHTGATEFISLDGRIVIRESIVLIVVAMAFSCRKSASNLVCSVSLARFVVHHLFRNCLAHFELRTMSEPLLMMEWTPALAMMWAVGCISTSDSTRKSKSVKMKSASSHITYSYPFAHPLRTSRASRRIFTYNSQYESQYIYK